jgi:hypothetical protein
VEIFAGVTVIGNFLFWQDFPRFYGITRRNVVYFKEMQNWMGKDKIYLLLHI